MPYASPGAKAAPQQSPADALASVKVSITAARLACECPPLRMAWAGGRLRPLIVQQGGSLDLSCCALIGQRLAALGRHRKGVHYTHSAAILPDVLTTQVVREVSCMQAALQQQAQEKKKKAPAVPRAAGGEKWWDSTLVEWPQNDFRCEPAPFTSSGLRSGKVSLFWEHESRPHLFAVKLLHVQGGKHLPFHDEDSRLASLGSQRRSVRRAVCHRVRALMHLQPAGLA